MSQRFRQYKKGLLTDLPEEEKAEYEKLFEEEKSLKEQKL